jgi:hypothetical protein
MVWDERSGRDDRGVETMEPLTVPNNLQIASPCPATWVAIRGDERVRFCFWSNSQLGSSLLYGSYSTRAFYRLSNHSAGLAVGGR